MKIVFLSLLPLTLLAQDLKEIMSPNWDDMAEKKELTVAKKLPQALQSALRSLSAEERWRSLLSESSLQKLNESELETFIKGHKLKIARQKSESKEELFAGKSEFVFFLRSWLPQLKLLPAEMQDEFLSEVAERYLEVFPPDDSGEIHFFVESLTLEFAPSLSLS